MTRDQAAPERASAAPADDRTGLSIAQPWAGQRARRP